MKPTLFLLAAGMGSRYGGLKQLDGLGPNGETILFSMLFVAGSVNLYSLSANLSRKTSVRKSSPNMRTISRLKSYSKT